MHKYRLLEEIGKGNYSTIYKAVRQGDGRVVAVKKSLYLYNQMRVKMDAQVSALRRLQEHPCVVRLLEVVLTQQDEFYMVFEHLPMSLIENYKLTKSTYSGRLGEQLIRSYIFQVALALEGMHQHHLMHRDIKPENIMVDGRTAKLIDFGLAKKNDFGKNTQYVSTRWYRAPEVLIGEPYSFSADVFSLGCVLLELYHVAEVFQGSSSLDQIYKLGEFMDDLDCWPAGCQKMLQLGIQLNRPGSRRAAVLCCLPEDAKDLVVRMLTFNPYQRIRAQDIIRHRYFKNVQLPKEVIDFLHQRRSSKISMRSNQNEVVTMKQVTSQKKLSIDHVHEHRMNQSPQPLGVTKRTFSSTNLVPQLNLVHQPTLPPIPSQQRTFRRQSENIAPNLLYTHTCRSKAYGLPTSRKAL